MNALTARTTVRQEAPLVQSQKAPRTPRVAAAATLRVTARAAATPSPDLTVKRVLTSNTPGISNLLFPQKLHSDIYILLYDM